MADQWTQTIVVSCLKDERAYRLHCEPEGAELHVEPGDVLTITFSGDRPHPFEMSRVEDGLMLTRLGDSEVMIHDKRGRSLFW
jgi:hypothetical protein